MSKIKQNKFKINYKEINIVEKLDNILDFFRDDMKFRDIECDIKIVDKIN